MTTLSSKIVTTISMLIVPFKSASDFPEVRNIGLRLTGGDTVELYWALG